MLWPSMVGPSDDVAGLGAALRLIDKSAFVRLLDAPHVTHVNLSPIANSYEEDFS